MTFLINLFFSITLLNLLFQLGNIITKNKSKRVDPYFFISIVFGYTILSLVVQYLLIFDSYSLISAIISISILISLLNIKLFIEKIKSLVLQLGQYNFPIILILAVLFLSIFHPVNDADSLGYHLFIPKEITINKKFQWNNSLYTFGLYGTGEFFNVILMLFKSSYLNNLLQFISLLFLFFELFGYNPKKNIDFKYLSFFGIPCLIYFFFGGKPHLMALAISIFLFRRTLKDQNFNQFLFFSTLIILPLIKINFLLSSFLLFIVYLINKFQKIKIAKSLLFIIPLTLLVYFPYFYFKIQNGFEFDLNIFLPIKNDFPARNEFLNFINNYKGESNLNFPINLFFSDNIGSYSTLMGLPFTLLILKKIKYNIIHNITSLFYLILIPIYIQPTARFIIEPLFWLYITNENSKSLISIQYIKFLSYPLALIQLIFFTLFTYNSIYSIFNPYYINSKTTYGYNFANNVNRLIDNNEGIIVDHRSKSLLNHKYVYTSDFIGFKWSKKEINNLLQINKINYIVARDKNLNEYLKYSNNIISGPHNFKEVTRNPISKGINDKFWILSFDKTLNCID